jgi:hypothetical protein
MAQEAPHLVDDISRGVGLVHLRLRLRTQIQSVLRVILTSGIGFTAIPLCTLWFRSEPHAVSGAIWWQIAKSIKDIGGGGHILHPLDDPRFWTADSIVSNVWFSSQAQSIGDLFWQGVRYAFLALPLLALGVIFAAGRIGRVARRPHLLRGRSLVTDTELADMLIRSGTASDLAIGNVPLVLDKETSHIMMAGTIGATTSRRSRA